MASIHYDKDVKGWLESHGIQYVKKSDNTQNCPQIRPIEKIWAFYKKVYSLMSEVCKSTEDLCEKWIEISGNISRNQGNAIMRAVRKKLLLVGKEGLLAPFK